MNIAKSYTSVKVYNNYVGDAIDIYNREPDTDFGGYLDVLSYIKKLDSYISMDCACMRHVQPF